MQRMIDDAEVDGKAFHANSIRTGIASLRQRKRVSDLSAGLPAAKFVLVDSTADSLCGQRQPTFPY